MTDFGSPTPAGVHNTKSQDVAAVSPKSQQEAQPMRAGLMTIPRELRDEIYDYLLRIDRFDTLRYDESSPSKLDLSILRVSQIIHSETSATLYGKNPWVYITIEPSLLRAFGNNKVGRRWGFPGQNPVTISNYARAMAVATVTMTLPVVPRRGPQTSRVPLLVSLFAISRLCRIITFTNYQRIHEVEIAVQLTAPTAGNVNQARQECLLNCFKEAREFGCAEIIDAQGNPSHVELATLMTSRFTSFQEIFDRASTYRDCGFRKEKLGRLSDARCDYQDGQYFIESFAYSGLPRRIGEESSNDRKVTQYIARMSTALSFSCAFLCIKLGDLPCALSLIESVLERRWYVHIDRVHAKAWFLYGLRDQAIGADNGAAYCFLQTLWKKPGHPGADQAVDEMEMRLRSLDGLTERIILHNIEHVLQPFRHLTRGSAVMSEAKYKVHVQQWYAGMNENDSVGFRHSRAGSVSLDHFQ